MKRILLAFLFLVFSFSCDSDRTPSGVLSEDEVVNVLIDIQLTEGMVGALPISYDSSQVLYALMEKEIFIKHGVEDSVFVNSMRYYLEDARKMDQIYSRVIDSLVVRESNPAKKEDLF
ncbi:DUF4296 domain-containing protein [Algoriphagus boritolerans]|uniref:DUF4296 domain-containing protein n=1 Tax=Algoriphagus boritolerans DSM 17298 = JCM 18970 TaxID=1120964 RepID=A0A1H5ZU21_9BACT|nr:DUF4296 domain-containing protein [Algoriphagus boritolerans]SEG39929.1 protein of unknown function [Algoriphagus boritolerans DSM 17298 = JCM 18970]